MCERGRPYAVLVGILAVLVFLPSLENGFAFDGVGQVAADERLRDPAAIPGLLVAPFIHDVPPRRSPYRPVTTLAYALAWQAGGGEPWPFHLLNVLLHGASSLLVWSLLVCLGASAALASVGAAAFAVHPVHVEAVANVVGLSDLLAAILCLAALRLHLSRRRSRTAGVVGVGVAYLLALGAKESAVALPLLVLMVDAVRPPLPVAPGSAGEGPGGPGGGVASVVRRLLPTWPVHAAMAVALLAFLSVRRSVLGAVVHMDVASYIVLLPTRLRLTTAVANLSHLARLLLFPRDLIIDYGPAVVMPVGAGSVAFWAGLTVLVGFLALAALAVARLGRAGLWVALSVGWVAATYALVSNVPVPLPMWMAERTLYLPSVGVALLLVGVLAAVGEGTPGRVEGRDRRLLAGSLVLLLAAGAWHTWDRSRVWASDDALFADLAERHPDSYRALWWAGRELVEDGQLQRGILRLRQATALNPNGAVLTLEYVRALLLAGKSREAEAVVRPIPPGLHPSRSVYLAQSLIFQGRLEEARDVVREGLAHFPEEVRLRRQARELGSAG